MSSYPRIMSPSPSSEEVLVKRLSPIQWLSLCWLSQPAGDRGIYRTIRRRRITTILEIGLGNAVRAHRMVRAATSCGANSPVRYTGIDLFESRPAGTSRIALVQAYRWLKGLGAQIKLVPSEPGPGLAKSLHQLHGTQLVVVSAAYEAEQVQTIWGKLRRIAGPDTVIYHQAQADSPFQLVTSDQLEQWSRPAVAAPRAA